MYTLYADLSPIFFIKFAAFGYIRIDDIEIFQNGQCGSGFQFDHSSINVHNLIAALFCDNRIIAVDMTLDVSMRKKVLVNFTTCAKFLISISKVVRSNFPTKKTFKKSKKKFYLQASQAPRVFLSTSVSYRMINVVVCNSNRVEMLTFFSFPHLESHGLATNVLL